MTGAGRFGLLHRLAWLVVAVALIGAGCGDDDRTDTEASPGPADPPTSAPERTGPAANSAPSVAVGETSLGSVLVDGEGMTLYLFTPDSDGVPTCETSCAELWPPVVDDDPVAGVRVDASLLGTVARSDGSSQVTYAGHPLYRYGEDSQPGDVTGHGINDVWFAVAPDGTAVREESSSARGDGY